MKQPTKSTRPPILLDKLARQDEATSKIADKDKNKQVGASSTQPQDYNNNNRQSICSSLLQTGNVQSFVDLFYISHKCLPNVMEGRNYFGEKLNIPEYLCCDQDCPRNSKLLYNFTLTLRPLWRKLR